MDIKKNITTINQWEGRFGYTVQAIVIHSMWGSYSGSIQWFKNPRAKASTHYCIKDDGEITMCVLEENSAWHSGDINLPKDKLPTVCKVNPYANFNWISIGVELEDHRNRNWKYPPIQYHACVELVADICKRHNIDPSADTIFMHKQLDPVNRSDPVGNWNHGMFIADVVEQIKKSGIKPKFTVWEGVVGIDCSLYVRKGPSRIYPTTGSKILRKGDKVSVVGYIEGEEIDGIKFWYQSTKGNYFWAGGTDRLPEEDAKIIMTREDYEAKKAELETRKSSLELRKAELEAAVAENNADWEKYNAEYTEFSAVVVEETAVDAAPVVETPVEVQVDPVVTPTLDPDQEKKAELETLYERLKALLGK